MSWLRKSGPAYGVEGVEPRRSGGGLDSFPGEALAGRPAVTEAVGRLPHDPVLADLPGYLSVATRDGQDWSLGFEDGVLGIFGLSSPGSDTFEQQLAAEPWIESVERVEREVFVFTTTELLAADIVLARCVDVCGEVFRRLPGGAR
ncbi:hypothetical protein [Paractinoplanes maris]|uniref:hypothetical protein n=1 Tax=Paractinoplanes maris TaxID=1734446 RepID=UPI0020202E71|nr:hypothetical protein [Actinoplanes maris]